MVLYIFYEEDNDNDYASVGFLMNFNNNLVTKGEWFV